MDKRLLVSTLRSALASELGELTERGLPEDAERASRVREIRGQLLMYEFLPLREYTDADVVCPGALIELELNGGQRAHYLVVPRGGGLVTSIEGRPVQVLTPQSPIGEQVLGRSVGDLIEVPTRSGERRKYRVVSVR